MHRRQQCRQRLLLLAALLHTTYGSTLVLPLHKRQHTQRLQRQPGRQLLLDGAYQLHGSVKDLEYFYVTLEMGTPPREYDLIVDTGSTMTYVPCETCIACGKHNNQPYGPLASSSYSLVPCNSSKCACGIPDCSCIAEQCVYERNYAEASSSKGYLVEDVLLLHGDEDSLGHHQGLRTVPLVFGCVTAETGAIYRQAADGLLGLGNSNASVINQLVQGGYMENRFSLCMGSVEGDGALLLGDLHLPGSVIEFDYVPMIPTTSHYYIVQMANIGVNNAPLNVRKGIFDIGYGVVLDSGTTFTHLPTEAYRAFVAALLAYTNTTGLQRIPGPDPVFSGMDVCWSGAPTQHELDKLITVFPTIQLYLSAGVVLQLGPVSYLFRHGKIEGAWCLGVFDNEHQGTLIGGITFRNVLVTYDRMRWRVGFAHAPCQQLGKLFSEKCQHEPSAAECQYNLRPAHEDPSSRFDKLNEHFLRKLWDRLTSLRGRHQATENDSATDNLSGQRRRRKKDKPRLYNSAHNREH